MISIWNVIIVFTNVRDWSLITGRGGELQNERRGQVKSSGAEKALRGGGWGLGAQQVLRYFQRSFYPVLGGGGGRRA